MCADQSSPLSRALRLGRYSSARAGAVQALLARLSTITETLELARATGLTAGQALYNAQMIRTHSLLLRTAQRSGFIVGGRQVILAARRHAQRAFMGSHARCAE